MPEHGWSDVTPRAILLHMEQSLLLDLFLIVMSISALVVALAIGIVAYHVYVILRRFEVLGAHVAKSLTLLEELIKKVPVFRRARRDKGERARTSKKEME